MQLTSIWSWHPRIWFWFEPEHCQVWSLIIEMRASPEHCQGWLQRKMSLPGLCFARPTLCQLLIFGVKLMLWKGILKTKSSSLTLLNWLARQRRWKNNEIRAPTFSLSLLSLMLLLLNTWMWQLRSVGARNQFRFYTHMPESEHLRSLSLNHRKTEASHHPWEIC